MVGQRLEAIPHIYEQLLLKQLVYHLLFSQAHLARLCQLCRKSGYEACAEVE